WPILMCSIVSLAIIIERFFFINSFEKKLKLLLEGTLKPNKGDVVYFLVENLPNEIKLINAERMLERFIPILAIIGSTSTLLGFTGTVTGMIHAFEAIKVAGTTSPQVVAGGIAEALLTTAFGLIVAIPTVFFYHIFSYKVERLKRQLSIFLKTN
ncbi:MAG: MotA/TolQ/ExbB proton channel family protein, partial [bacterium]|nr:MotA/TolQ/ExbB proton channel family protein [bacterium]